MVPSRLVSDERFFSPPGVYVAYATAVFPLAEAAGDGSCPNSETVALGANPAGLGGNLGVDPEPVDEVLAFLPGTAGGTNDLGLPGALLACITACANMSSSALVSSMWCDAGLSARAIPSSGTNRLPGGARYGLDRPLFGAEPTGFLSDSLSATDLLLERDSGLVVPLPAPARGEVLFMSSLRLIPLPHLRSGWGKVGEAKAEKAG